MKPELSPNTKAILLLTAPLIAGRGTSSPDLLTPGEYKRLARHLRGMQRQPADLLCPDATDLLRACQPVIDEGRLQRLLGRGFLLSQVIEHWQARAIWVVSRADPEYPRRLKVRLREDSPAVLYGCGDISLLDYRGLAVVGSRHVDETLIEYTMDVGRLAARVGSMLVSGGAKGIDQAAMRGALEVGGKVCGVLADSLEKTSMNRDHRNLVLDDKLVLISPYDPVAGFNVGNAMQRNKLIYALADASLVVSSDLNKGGTWSGAAEQLDKLKFVPVYVRSTGESSAGLDALRKKGAIPWPNPCDADEFEHVFEWADSTTAPVSQPGLLFLPVDGASETEPVFHQIDACVPTAETDIEPAPTPAVAIPDNLPVVNEQGLSVPLKPELLTEVRETVTHREASPAELLFAAVRVAIPLLLKTPMKDSEIAISLDISNSQAKLWLQRLLIEGVLERQKKPAGYIVKSKRLFG